MSKTALKSLWLWVAMLVLSTTALAQRVNVNDADVEELSQLPGIGRKLAEAIVQDRDAHGPFLAVEDLTRVAGVSSGVLAKVQGRVTTDDGAAGSGAVITRQGDTVSAEVAQRVLNRFAAEPSIREVQVAVLDYAQAHPDLVASWRLRSRTAALLPEFRSRVDYELDDDLRTRTDTSATEAVVETRDNDVGYKLQVQGTWSLDELVFNPQELAVTREGVRLANLRDRVLDDATRRYFERRRLQVDLEMSPPKDLNERIRKDLRVQELTADLDALSGGWFSKKLDEAGRAAY